MKHTTQIVESAAPQAIVERQALTSALAKVCNVVERRNTIPMLACAMLRGTDDGLLVRATDLDQEITAFVPGACDVRFAGAVDANKLLQLLKKAKPSDHVGMSLQAVDDEPAAKVILDFEGLEVTMNGLDPDDYPVDVLEIPADQASWSFDLSRGDLATALSKVAFAMSSEETRYYLNGAYMLVHAGALRFVATDGHRLGRFDLDGVFPENLPGVIVPSGAIYNLQKILKAKDCADHVKVTMTESRAHFEIGDVKLATTFIDGTFANYERVIAISNDKLFSCNADDLAAAVKEVSVISSEKGRAVKFGLGLVECTISCTNPDSGSAKTSLAGHWDQEGLFEIGLNSQYVTDIMAVIGKGADVVMAFNDYGSPVVITSPADARFLAVQMPMRV